MIKNNITRFLDSKKIPYTAHKLPEETRSAVASAKYLNAPLDHVIKSIVLERISPGKPVVAMIPATGEADPKKIAKLINEKKVAVTTLQQAEKLTQLKAGGITPLALINKGFEFILEKKILDFEEIYISGGQVGINIRLPVTALIEILSPIIGDASRFDKKQRM